MIIQDGLKNNPISNRFIFLISLLFSSFSVFADDCVTGSCAAKSYKGQCTAGGFDCYPTRPRGILVLSGGYGYSHPGASQTIHSDGIAYDYDADGSVQSQPFGGITLGGEFQFPGGIGLDVGIAYYQTAAYKAKGDVTINGGGNATSYNYKILGRQALIEVKILSNDGSPYHPYITLGAGEAFNSVYDYDTEATNTPHFENGSTHRFSFSGGAGLDIDLMSHVRFGVGYRYANFGDADLGSGHLNDDETETLEMSNFNTQAWIAQLTILI